MTTTSNTAFGRALRDARTTAGMSLRTLAKRLGVSPAYLCEVEKGYICPFTMDRTIKAATLLEVDPELLLLARALWSGVVEVPLTGRPRLDSASVSRAFALARWVEDERNPP